MMHSEPLAVIGVCVILVKEEQQQKTLLILIVAVKQVFFAHNFMNALDNSKFRILNAS